MRLRRKESIDARTDGEKSKDVEGREREAYERAGEETGLGSGDGDMEGRVEVEGVLLGGVMFPCRMAC